MPRIRVQCPHCQHTLAPGFLRSAVGRLNNAKRVPKGKAKVMSPCPFKCGESFGARDMRDHKRVCQKNPRVQKLTKGTFK